MIPRFWHLNSLAAFAPCTPESQRRSFPHEAFGSAVPSFQLRPVFAGISKQVPPYDATWPCTPG